MTRIISNRILHPTKRIIENWNRDFRTSDGPNTSSFINLDDIAIPYDSHYVSRVILPSNSENYQLDYGLLNSSTFLLIKVTYNDNYDNINEDSFDPLYYYEPINYNINYYFENNSGKTYPIGKILLLSASLTNKLEKIYLNNPLDYDVILDIFNANIDENIQSISSSSAMTISNLYYSDIITDQTDCIPIWYTTTTTTYVYNPETTTTTTIDLTTTTTTTTTNKYIMKIIKTIVDEYHVYSSSGDTVGFFDYYKNNEWILAGKNSNFIEFTNLNDIVLIRFYFELNDTYYGTLKTNRYYPLNHNNGLYFVDIIVDSTLIDTCEFDAPDDSEILEQSDDSEIYTQIGIYTGSTEFIVNEYIMTLSGYNISLNYIIYDTIISIEKDSNNNAIYMNTTDKYYTLKFLTSTDCDKAYIRLLYVYDSYLNGNCSYLTIENIYENNIIIDS